MGDVVRWKSRHTQMCVGKNPSPAKQREVLRQSPTATTLELLFVSLVFSKSAPVQNRAELRFGEGRPPSAGRLVESQPRKKRKERRKRRQRKRGPVFT